MNKMYYYYRHHINYYHYLFHSSSGFIRLFHPKVEKDTIQPIPPQLSLVNISSLLAVEPFANWGLYATGKSARDMLLRIVAKEEDKVKKKKTPLHFSFSLKKKNEKNKFYIYKLKIKNNKKNAGICAHIVLRPWSP